MTTRILIVDDEQHILQVLSIKLRNAGYDVATASDGEEALDLATAEPPDLVITDFQMPYMTGLELSQAMAAQDSTRRVPIVMLTARGYALEEGAVESCNIRDVLSKPFSPRAVLQLVQRLLAEEEQERSRAA